jgi:hypothetical protein
MQRSHYFAVVPPPRETKASPATDAGIASAGGNIIVWPMAAMSLAPGVPKVLDLDPGSIVTAGVNLAHKLAHLIFSGAPSDYSYCSCA